MTFYEDLALETAGERQYLLASPVINRALDGAIDLVDYVSFLAQAYHHVRHTVPLLMATGARLAQEREWLCEAVARYIAEEIGHHEWVLNDIAACGFDREAARLSTPGAAVELMVAYAYDTINRVDPLGFFGMVYVLEGTSVAVATRAAQHIREHLGLPAKAFTYLDSHGALDVGHTRFLESLFERIDDERERRVIVHAARMFFTLYANVFRSLPVPEFVRPAARDA
ncbi:MAG: iron-containing redox enzyme family protein [Pseudomonadales bacterium]|jgi:pyrroloquinoline quinone (PQQ) biosynthesis protein C|nr:iron-containing redox enzyme family protein [Pseudomonadales bacterium]